VRLHISGRDEVGRVPYLGLGGTAIPDQRVCHGAHAAPSMSSTPTTSVTPEPGLEMKWVIRNNF